MKLKFSVDMLCVGVYEGCGREAGSLGGISVQSLDGGIENNCGSGFSAVQRRYYWDYPSAIVGKVIEIEANDILSSRGGKKRPSLSLPIFIEVRSDKTIADSTDDIYSQLKYSKGSK